MTTLANFIATAVALSLIAALTAPQSTLAVIAPALPIIAAIGGGILISALIVAMTALVIDAVMA